jgi:hypothetical protein
MSVIPARHPPGFTPRMCRNYHFCHSVQAQRDTESRTSKTYGLNICDNN